jgi:hypothetical protein
MALYNSAPLRYEDQLRRFNDKFTVSSFGNYKLRDESFLHLSRKKKER